ncbi:hypothetical protein CLV90_1326 [Maribacter spongiicola]|uniref:Uncharacterized protein n=1 Tax=Maribacter spongiicola TaxID=1206753 RepID=A0A4R7K8I1_9FLAO|nr:hypothetical protein CLV90_1326 [Maribacter spongiicola]
MKHNVNDTNSKKGQILQNEKLKFTLEQKITL